MRTRRMVLLDGSAEACAPVGMCGKMTDLTTPLGG